MLLIRGLPDRLPYRADFTFSLTFASRDTVRWILQTGRHKPTRIYASASPASVTQTFKRVACGSVFPRGVGTRMPIEVYLSKPFPLAVRLDQWRFVVVGKLVKPCRTARSHHLQAPLNKSPNPGEGRRTKEGLFNRIWFPGHTKGDRVRSMMFRAV